MSEGDNKCSHCEYLEDLVSVCKKRYAQEQRQTAALRRTMREIERVLEYGKRGKRLSGIEKVLADADIDYDERSIIRP
jgi:hypothetical protein